MSSDPLVKLPDPTPCETRAALVAALRHRRAPRARSPWLSSFVQRAGRVWDRVTLLGRARQAEDDAFPVDHDLVTTSWTAVLDDALGSGLPREVLAARLAYAAMFVRSKIADGVLGATDAERGLEVDSYSRFFSTSLAPSRYGRLRCRSAELTHIAVIVRGRCFRIEMVDARGESLSLSDLVGAIRACVAASERAIPGPCAATAARFGAFAQFYERACVEEQNLSSFSILGSALCVICLDDEAPGSVYETGYLTHVGNRSNRWYLHALQFVVFANGRAAVIGSFTAGLAGTQAIAFLDALTEELRSLDVPRERPLSARDSARAHALRWALDGVRACDHDVRPTRHAPEAMFSVSLGTHDARALGVTPALAFHVVFQAAARMRVGCVPPGPAFQLVSMRHVSGGSLSEQDTTSDASRTLADALATGASPATLRRLLGDAREAYATSLFAVRNGFTLQHPLASLPKFVRAAAYKRTHDGEWARWSLLPKPPGVAIFGRFGVTFTVPTCTAGHAFIAENSTDVVVVQGESPILPLARIGEAVDIAAGRLRSAIASQATTAPEAASRGA